MPLLRLLAFIAIIIAVLVVFGLMLQSCSSTSKHDSYQRYLTKVATIAHSSTQDGVAGGDRAHHAGPEGDRSLLEAVEHRRGGASERDRTPPRSIAPGPAPRREPADRRGTRAAGQRHAGARRHVQGHGRLDRDQRRVAARCAGRPAAGERRHLGRPVLRADEAGAAVPRASAASRCPSRTTSRTPI